MLPPTLRRGASTEPRHVYRVMTLDRRLHGRGTMLQCWDLAYELLRREPRIAIVDDATSAIVMVLGNEARK